MIGSQLIEQHIKSVRYDPFSIHTNTCYIKQYITQLFQSYLESIITQNIHQTILTK